MPDPRWIYIFGQGQADAGNELKHLVGGKGASLGEMTRGGLNVPPGFTISAECCDLFHENNQSWPDGLADQVRSAVAWLENVSGRKFGHREQPLLVAVRSGAAQSMPGMMDTVLNVGLEADPWRELFAAIEAVFRSWNSERAVAYRKHHRIDGLLGTAVNVQMMCPSEVSGVMFTANPVNPALEEIVIESAYGLGEALVLGKVTPDRFTLDKTTLALRERVLAVKTDATGAASEGASLRDGQIEELAKLGLRVEGFFGHPCDIEWGWAAGQFYLLQSRAIKAAGRAMSSIAPGERETVRTEEIDALRSRAAPGGTVWSRFNLAEILPAPTPMTWSIVKKFMSGQGGFGLMYRDLGFDPDPALDEVGIFDLICGRPYCNLSREPRMQYKDLPFEHKFAMLKANSAKALYPQAVLNPAKAGWKFWLFLPGVFFRLWRSSVKLQQISKSFAARFEAEIVPPFVEEAQAAAKHDLTQLSETHLLERLDYWIKRTLYDFARDSLKPTALAAVAMGNLERVLTLRYQPPGRPVSKGDEPTGLQKAQAVLRELVMGVRPAPEADLGGGLRDLGSGKISHDEFLSHFGHRGHQEMELSKRRWTEEPETLASLMTGDRILGPADKSQEETVARKWDQVATELKLTPPQRVAIEAELQRLRNYLKLREAGKHHLMRGYALIRRCLMELDRRLQLDGGIFFLTLDELPGLSISKHDELRRLIEARRRQREIALSLPVPPVIFSDDLDIIGRDLDVSAAESFQGVGISAGVAEGAAWVLDEVAGAKAPFEPYVLVCPSTDPAWVPLFVRARGLVMETGGVLSHGAIVARDFGLPAVAGIADVQRRIKTGQRLRLDGASGKVTVLH
ncbi:MAG: hypothetical protein HY040_19390 [Planctomycetes bacterium]|nr:hypothetical protein [Planctomycetota bacterium]